MRVCKLLIIIFTWVLLIQCNPNPFEAEKISNEDKLNSFIYQYLLIVYFPEQSKKASCEKPNAIPYNNGTCTDLKVTSGLIYYTTNNESVTKETLGADQSFRCSCEELEPTEVYWKKAVDIVESPPPNPNLTIIYSNGKYTNQVDYQIHYKQPDNLYCIARCSGYVKYQFLKIR